MRARRTLAEDESTCVVFGMPKEAIRLGGVDSVVPLEGIPEAIMRVNRCGRTAGPAYPRPPER